MAERIPNHTCQKCGKRYYACPDCERNGSWRAIACSPECYKALEAELESVPKVAARTVTRNKPDKKKVEADG